MLLKCELVNVRKFKSKDKELYVCDILVVDDKHNTCIYSQFVDKNKYDNVSNLLEDYNAKIEPYIIEHYEVYVRNNDLKIVFDI